MEVINLQEILKQGKEIALQEIRAERAERWAQISDLALIWQILAPTWTLTLACACDFPTDGWRGIEQIFRQMEAAGVCYSICPSSALPQETPWLYYLTTAEMRDEIRREVLLKDQFNPAFLRLEAGKIGRRILEVETYFKNQTDNRFFGNALPENTLRWARLVFEAQNLPVLADWFDNLTNNLLAERKSGELLRWIETARDLESIFGTELGFIIARAVRRLELFHRRAEDERHLTKLLKRDEQITAFKDLLKDEVDWALHYVGAGGAGKTMLIRHLTANVSKELYLSIARVDFDYLNPDYPARSPGLLLAYLAEEFRVYAPNSSAVGLLADVTRKIVNLHDNLQVSSGQTSLDSILKPIFDDVIPLFADALRQLPGPVIILDTCEELLKIRVDGTVPPSLEATFKILEALHNVVGNLRVVFSGRRPLASTGAGWTAENCPLPPRSYLRIHEIRGFTRAEAGEYLGEIEKLNDFRPDAIEPIIANSIEQIKISHFRRNSPARPESEVRYNPFELWLYASWLNEDKSLPLAELKAANSHRYVEMRIIRRLTNRHMLSMLPYVALLGRFSSTTLQSISNFEDKTAFNEIFTELGNLEWTSLQAGQILEVDRALQPRLLAFFEHGQTEEFREARRKTVDYLENSTLTEKRSELDKTYFIVAFRLLKTEPERALRWWRKIERRFADEKTYDWLREICMLILGIETGETIDLKTPELTAPNAQLLAATLISYAAASLQTNSLSELESIWTQAVSLLEKYEDDEKNLNNEDAKHLLIRARAGQLATAGRFNPQKVTDEKIGYLWQTLGELKIDELGGQLAGSMIAAIENVTEMLENSPRKLWPDIIAALTNFIVVLSATPDYRGLIPFVNTLYGRLLILFGEQTKGLDMLRNAASGDSKNLAATVPNFPDWIAPLNIDSRIKLEFIRFAYPAIEAAKIQLTVGAEIPVPATVDDDRLGSAILALRGAINLPSPPNGEELASQSHYSIQQESTCNAHRAFPPLFAAFAEAFAAAGHVDEAIDTLQARSLLSEASNRSELATTHEADRALLRIARRMRLRDENLAIDTSISSSSDFADADLLWTNEAVSNPKREIDLYIERFFGTPSTPNRRPALIHARFRSIGAFYPETTAKLAGWLAEEMPPTVATALNSFEWLMCFLDCVELNEISRRQNLPEPFPKISIDELKQSLIWQQTIKTDSLEKLILLVRQTALENERVIQDDGRDKILLDKIGRRRAAGICLEEGEMLSLRWPERVNRLFGLAHKLFAESRDDVGEFISRICQALALARTDNVVNLEITLSKIRTNYKRHSYVNFRGFRNWAALEKLAENPALNLLSNIGPRGWSPWLMRLIACLVWQNDGYLPGRKTNLLVQWLEKNYGIKSNEGIVLPAEFEGWLNKTTLPERSPRESVIPEQSKISLVITIPQPTKDDGIFQTSLTARLSANGTAQSWQATELIDTLIPYRIMAENLSALTKSSPILPALAKQKVIKLEVEYGASRACWEAVVNSVLSKYLTDKMDFPCIHRTIPGFRIKPVDPWESIDRILTWTNDNYAGELAQNAWNDVVTVAGLSYQTISSQYMPAFWEDRIPPGILHIVGTPTETSAGIRMNMSAESIYETESPIESADGNENYNFGSQRELIKVENLISQFPQLSICILQSLPGETVSERTRSDRRQAACLRIMGAELFRSGVPLVITIPAFSPELFEPVLRQIVAGLEILKGPDKAKVKTADVTGRLLETITGARQFITESKITNQEDMLESALDICLYAADS